MSSRLCVRALCGAVCVLMCASVSAADSARPGKSAIASAHVLATEAGFTVIKEGGNAFDAAVAVASTLSVVEPQSSGIGGGAFFLLHRAKDDKNIFLDARETAPAATNPKDYLDAKGNLDQDKSWNVALAAGIPGEPASLVWLAEHYGKLPLAKSLAPAIRIAREGFKPDSRFLAEVGDRREVMKRYPASAALFLPDGEVPKAGWVMKNPDLAKVLENIAAHGNDGFYRGAAAKQMVDGVKALGGNWSLEDLSGYQVKEREPLTIDYRGYRIVTAPPPSSGGILLTEMMNILGGYDLASLDRVHRVHLIVESMRRAYRDRAEFLGDPDFVKMPLDRMASPYYAAGLRAGIHPEKATPSDMLPGFLAPPAGPHTSHFSIIDSEGNFVAATQTVNLEFGAALVLPGTGFVLNNEMDDFALKAGTPNAFGLVGNAANAPAAGRRPLSSMTPSFVMGDDKVLVIGTPGGSRIITMVLEGILAWLDGDDPAKVAANPRFHHQYLPDVVSAEPKAFSADEIKGLEAMGHKVTAGTRTWGFMNAVDWNKKTGEMRGGTDPRGVSGSAQVK
jgi:gamma-glutamyltranspeptidase/glutathione hydrolase